MRTTGICDIPVESVEFLLTITFFRRENCSLFCNKHIVWMDFHCHHNYKLVNTCVFSPCRGLMGKQSWGFVVAVKWRKISMVSGCVSIPVCAALSAKSSRLMAGSLIKFKADPAIKSTTSSLFSFHSVRSWQRCITKQYDSRCLPSNRR